MKRKIALVACVGASLVASSPVHAIEQKDGTAVEEIVATAVSPARLVDVLVQSYDKSFRDNLAPRLSPLEKRYPGLTAQARADANATLRKAMTAQTPTLFDALRAIYMRELSSSEITALRDFYRSQAGRRMAEAAFTGASNQTLADVGHTDLVIGRQRAHSTAAKQALTAISADDLPALSTFAKTTAAAKMSELKPLQQKTVQEWMVSIDAQNRSDIQNTITASIRRYIAAHTASGSRSR